MWPFDRKQPIPIGAINGRKRHWDYDPRVNFGLKQVRKLESFEYQLRWLTEQMEDLAGKNNERGLNLCVDVIHHFSRSTTDSRAAALFDRSIDIQARIHAGEPGKFATTRPCQQR